MENEHKYKLKSMMESFSCFVLYGAGLYINFVTFVGTWLLDRNLLSSRLCVTGQETARRF